MPAGTGPPVRQRHASRACAPVVASHARRRARQHRPVTPRSRAVHPLPLPLLVGPPPEGPDTGGPMNTRTALSCVAVAALASLMLAVPAHAARGQLLQQQAALHRPQPVGHRRLLAGTDGLRARRHGVGRPTRISGALRVQVRRAAAPSRRDRTGRERVPDAGDREGVLREPRCHHRGERRERLRHAHRSGRRPAPGHRSASRAAQQAAVRSCGEDGRASGRRDVG